MNDDQKTKEQLLEDLAQERERSLALAQVSKRVASAHDTDEILELIVNEAARLVGAHAGFLRLLQGDVLVASASTDSAVGYLAETAEAIPVGPEESFAGRVMATKSPIVVEDTLQSEPRFSRVGNPEIFGLRSVVGIPLLANDSSIGVLAVFDDRIRRFTEDEVALLTAFADQASLALEKARLLNEAETERERADSLYRISNQLAGAHDTDEVLDLIVNEAARLLDATGAYIRLLEGSDLVPSAATESLIDYLADSAKAHPTIAIGATWSGVGQVMATKTPVVRDDAAVDERLRPETRFRVKKHGFHGTALVPLVANDHSIGVLTVMDKRICRFTDDEISLLSAFADQASLALEKARLLNEANR